MVVGFLYVLKSCLVSILFMVTSRKLVDLFRAVSTVNLNFRV